MEQETQQVKAFVKYEQPSFEELQRRFPACVADSYEFARFYPTEFAIAGAMGENREVTFEHVHTDFNQSSDEALDEMDRRGLRPALYEELLGLAEIYPLDPNRKIQIVALGSEMAVDECNDMGLGIYVAVLQGSDDGWKLDMEYYENAWPLNSHFLAVRK